VLRRNGKSGVSKKEVRESSGDLEQVTKSRLLAMYDYVVEVLGATLTNCSNVGRLF
jgi:hypothetical protein